MYDSPPPPKMTLKIISFNPNGLKSPGRLASLLTEASRAHVDVLLIQEHNLGYSGSSGVRSTAARAGFAACVGYTNGTRGGSAIFLMASTFGLDPWAEHACSTHLGRRVTLTSVDAGGERLDFASVYVPVDAQRRGIFLGRLKAGKLCLHDQPLLEWTPTVCRTSA